MTFQVGDEVIALHGMEEVGIEKGTRGVVASVYYSSAVPDRLLGTFPYDIYFKGEREVVATNAKEIAPFTPWYRRVRQWLSF